MRPTPEGRIVIGAQEVDRLADERTDVSTPPPWADRLLQMAQRDMPGLQGLRLEEVWLGVRPMPADRLPIIGRVPGIEGVYVAVMHSGITLASIVGQALSTEVVTGPVTGGAIAPVAQSGLACAAAGPAWRAMSRARIMECGPSGPGP